MEDRENKIQKMNETLEKQFMLLSERSQSCEENCLQGYTEAMLQIYSYLSSICEKELPQTSDNSNKWF